MKRTSRKGTEVLRSPRLRNSTEGDQLYRKLAVMASRRRSIEVQLNGYKDRINALNEILQKIRTEEVTLANLLKSNMRLPSNDGGDMSPPSLPKTVGHMGKEMVFRF